MFSKTSRYRTVETVEFEDATGRVVRHKELRLTPRPRAVGRHVVEQGERTDHVAVRRLRDPLRYWRLCDANRVLWPEDLVAEPGRPIAVPPPEG